MTILCTKLIKVGAKIDTCGRYAVFLIAEVAVSRQMFREIFRSSPGCARRQRRPDPSGGRRKEENPGACALMPRNKAVRNMRPLLGLVPEVSGLLYLSAAISKLPWKAKMATLMVGTSGHPGNVG